jgi:UDP-3-O-[3-hydroxymyristoyl] N-acetylglucosamine deacetylase / 3-hydroxyacyl-[acyl-carrier-protein] dehydratase
MTKQCTIKEATTVKGVGLHTGQVVTMTLHPAPENHGFRFRRTDIDGQPTISADVSKVFATNRGTILKEGEAQVSTVEHLLSAFIGLGVDNVLVDIDGGEVPIMDGSALPFVIAIEAAGIVELEAERVYFDLREPLTFKDETTGAEFLAMPSEEYTLTTLIDFNSPVLGPQFATLEGTPQYKTEIAPARTFVFVHELEFLLNEGLIKGGDLDNAVVIANRAMSEEEVGILATKLGKPTLKVEREGILNTTQLRFQNEPARHKLLDVIGDLALVGRFLKAKIVATKPGHTANVAFAKFLKRHIMEQTKLRSIPKYDPSVKPVMDVNQIMKKLPHRFPFLFVDQVLELSPSRIVAMKQSDFSWGFAGGSNGANGRHFGTRKYARR